jgi:RNA polymerase sigma-70 factor (ECF subfamily)
MGEPDHEAARWLPAARAGSPEALGQALEACRGYLLLIARHELPQDLQAKGGASDLVQETFLEAQRDFAQFQGSTTEELLAWLRRLLLNNIANFARCYRDTAKRAVGREQHLPAGSASDASEPGLVAQTPSPSEQVVTREQEQALRQALSRLPDDYREAIRLRHEEGLPFEEIGRRLQRTPNAARMLWLRAVERLQKEVAAPSHES